MIVGPVAVMTTPPCVVLSFKRPTPRPSCFIWILAPPKSYYVDEDSAASASSAIACFAE
ncbi:hypothetical protein CAter282_1369 [Collimonas arenae]|uniref:Uncharacterized protein n=1 Tax=Collimonas arenae TaxID=279058 RepID=A0A127QGI1_9BURK|nr:hypothetical protein CAter10_1473 [Collimonas arenae]AMP09160.1 hypothetical protein CAter282_1369 [Collimonas arenae]